MRMVFLALMSTLCSAGPGWAQGAAPAPRPGQPLAHPQALLEELRFEEAATLLRQTVERGGLDPETLAAGYLLWAEAEASMGRAPFAAELFGRALELSPSSLLAADAPPKVQRPFEQARQKLQGRALRAQVQSRWLSDGRARTELTVSDDVHGLARGARLLPHPDGEPRAFTQLPMGEVTWECARPPCGYSVELWDASGNTLRRLGEARGPLMVDRAAPGGREPGVEARDSGGGLHRAWPLVAGASAAGIVAGVLAARFSSTQAELEEVTRERDQHRYAEVESLDASRRKLRVAALGAGALAVGLGVGAVLVW